MYKLVIEGSSFHNNSAGRGGGLYFLNGTANISECRFSFNTASDHGGSIFLAFSNATIISSQFENNKAETLGGALRAMNGSQVYILESASFENNSAFYGAAVHLYRAEKLECNGVISIINNKGSLGIIGVINSEISFFGSVSFADNVGSLFCFGSYVYFGGTATFNRHKVGSVEKDYNNTLEKKEGGCITLLLSKLSIKSDGMLSLRESVAINGGGILAISSNIDVASIPTNSTSLMIVRNKPFWISSTNDTFMVYEDCPFTYCFPSVPPISINLDRTGGVDAQCNFNRSGILCGRCQEGLTLSIGSSHCIECKNYWPVMFLLVVIGTFLAGLVLVVLLMLTNLTVAAGTLNGVIFYANIFSANRGLFMPYQHTNFHSVFIAWLNLDVSFDICFIKGMDTYVKAWLQIVFPIYLILVVVAIMIASKHSAKFSKVIARKNPVATLATLILLSYTKLLNSVITTLSFATLSFIPISGGDPFEEKRWLYDASMPYFAGKHFPLLIIAIIIMILGIVYTFLLLFWQWLVLLPDQRIFRWVRNTKLSSFIDAYHAPFTPRNRYWTGLLLLSRAVVHLTAAINVSGKPSINLLAVSLTVGFVLLLQGYSGIRTYKKWMLNVLEFTSYFNILAFTMAKFYVLLTEGSHTTIASLSIGIEFVLFIFIIAYHAVVETNVFHKVMNSKWYTSHFHKDLSIPFLSNYQDQELISNRYAVTTTEVQLLGADSNLERVTEPEADDIVGKEREDIALLF